MPAIKPDQLDEQIRSGKLGSLYGFDGPESWLKTRAVRRITEKLIPPEAKDFNLERLDGNDASAGAIVNAVQSLPWMSDRRLVIVTAVDALSASESRIVAEALTDLPSSTCLVLVYAEKANLRDPIAAEIVSRGQLATFWPPFANQLPGWVMNEGRQRGKTISSEAAQRLADSCEDLQEISDELDKLFLFVGKKSKIDVSDIEAHGLPNESGNHKDLEQAILERNLTGALRQGWLLSETGMRAEAIFPILERVFRTLILAQDAVRRGSGSEDVWSEVGVRGKTQQGFYARAFRLYRWDELVRGLRRIGEYDRDLKTGVLPSAEAVSLLLRETVGKPETSASGFR